MQLTLLKAKLHRARVTQADLDYEGSCSIDSHLLEVSGILPYEQIQIYNVSNGERLTTYAISAQAGSGTICMNGAAAHRAKPGDIVIICAYAGMNAAEAASYKPRLVYLDDHNRITRTSNALPVQAA